MRLLDRVRRAGDSRLLVRSQRDSLFASDLPRIRSDAFIYNSSSILLSIRSPVEFVKCLLAFDGAVRSIILASYAHSQDQIDQLCSRGGVTHLISDRDDISGKIDVTSLFEPAAATSIASQSPHANEKTIWGVTTSGTTGTPKMVSHSLASLTRTVRGIEEVTATNWGMLYDMSRFAGLQVLFQALLTGGSLLSPDLEADVAGRVRFLASHGCSHLSATPTMWRRFLMEPSFQSLQLRQITLGGEIADDALLQALRRTMPSARITQIYASSEAGVGFSVKDGKAGFPAAFVESPPPGIALKISDGLLWIRPEGHTPNYLGPDEIHTDDAGFINTFDRVEQIGDRIHFRGRDNGSINIGGVKVYPEEVERLIHAIGGVAMCHVTPKTSPIMGHILVATVVPQQPIQDEKAFKRKIIDHCRTHLPREAVPASLTFATSLSLNSSGKPARK